jgi:hypothetical protein
VIRWVAAFVLFAAAALTAAEKPFCIEVVDEATGRGVPLVELETMDSQFRITDSAGRVAFSEPGQMNVPVFFSMRTHGYELPMDGFGMTGKRLTPKPGERVTIKIKRVNIAERLCRLTGMGIYRDTVLLGEKAPLAQPLSAGGVAGQDSVNVVKYRDRLFWLWGDTNRMSYPLGNFRTTCAWSDLPEKGGLPPSQGVNFEYIVGDDGFAKEMCPLERKEGVVWLMGLLVVSDESGKERMLAHYSRRSGLTKELEHGLAIYDDEKQIFERLSELPLSETWRFPNGNAIRTTQDGADWFYFGEAALTIRAPANLKALADPAQYEAWTCAANDKPTRKGDGTLDYAWRKSAMPMTSQKERDWVKAGLIKPDECQLMPLDVASNQPVTLHAGSVNWNEHRKRWVMIAVQIGGKSSLLGEVWYCESNAPHGPWTRAVKVVTHDRYSFYNPAHHPFFDEEGGRRIYFEGTYSHTFSGRKDRTPHYDYNQMLYCLDLDDPRLKPAQQ